MIIIVHHIPIYTIIHHNIRNVVIIVSLSPLTWSFREQTPFPDNAMLLEVNVDGSKPIIYPLIFWGWTFFFMLTRVLGFWVSSCSYWNISTGSIFGALRYHQTWLASPSFIAGWRSFYGWVVKAGNPSMICYDISQCLSEISHLFQHQT